MSFITNAEMSFNLFKQMMKDDGMELTQEEESYWMEKFKKCLDFLENEFDDSIGLKRLTEIRDSKEPPCDQ